ncbi:MAG: alkaline phosphatase D family protein, partial [Chryseotalea sp.]
IFAQKESKKKAHVEFLQINKDDTVRQRERLYSTTTIKNIRIINLDTRYFRDTVYKYYFIDSLTQKRTYGFKQNTEGDILGEAQWLWLEKTLAESNEKFIIINSSVQVIARDQRWEKWGNFPNSLNRLHMLIAKFPEKRVMFISGDRHIAEISSEKIEGVSYPLYDFTSSGLTHTWDSKKIEKNRFRVGELIIEKNYGIIRIKENINNYAITMQVWGEQKKVLLEENVTLPK